MARPKLFLLDAMALIYRAHFVFVNNPRVTSTGVNTSAAFGFLNSLLEVLDKEKPTHLAVVFDTDKPTFRHEKYEQYKAQREAPPEELIRAIPMVQRLMAAMNIAVLSRDGFEADDIMGTLAKRGAADGFEVYLMTMDKDMAQLVGDSVYLYRPGLGGKPHEVLDAAKVVEKYGVPPTLIPDLLGLKGDASDNIPGVPKVGDKTALELLQQFGSLEGILAGVESITKKAVKASLIENAELGRFSKELATIHCDVPLELAPADLRVGAPDRDRLEPLLAELEFRTLARRLLGSAQQPAEGQQSLAFGGPEAATAASGAAPPPALAAHTGAHKTLAEVAHTYIICDTPATRKQAIAAMQQARVFCFDTETTSLDPLEAELVGIALCAEPHTAYYIPVASEEEARTALAELTPILHNSALKVAQNAKYDMAVLSRYGHEVAPPMFDTMLAHFLIRAEGKHSMDAMARDLLGYDPIALETLIGKKGKGQKSVREVPIEQLGEYSAEDADVTLQLYQLLEPKLDAVEVRGCFEQIEMPLVPVLVAMENEGVRVDTDFLVHYSLQLEKDLAHREAEIYRLAGDEFNINSPKQLGEILFDRLKLRENPKRTATGQYSTDEETLEELASEHPLPAEIVAYRQLAKLKSTYVDALPLMVSPITGRVHTSFNQAVAVTGRLSSNNPNLQNIPIRTDQGREVRKAFIPRGEDYVLLSADYSQIELRLMAHFSEDESLIDAFTRGEDIHAATAARIFSVALDAVTSDMRRTAKMANFGIIYGITAFGLAQRLGIPRGEAKAIIDTYFAQYPGVKRHMEASIDKARSLGYVTTIGGRRQYLPNITSRNPTVRGFAERNAINTPLQGSAADLIKLAMIRIHREMREQKLRSRMVLQVHDELVFDAHTSEVGHLKPLVETAMREALSLRVPLEVGLGTGANWLDAH